jgi:hypothetical protein
MFYRLPMTHSREEQNRVNTKYMTDGTAVLTFAVHLASTAIGPRFARLTRGANLPGREKVGAVALFSVLFIPFSTAICNLLLVHVLLGGYFSGARLTPIAL